MLPSSHNGLANDLGEPVVEDEHAGGAEAAEGVGEGAVEEAAHALLRRRGKRQGERGEGGQRHRKRARGVEAVPRHTGISPQRRPRRQNATI
jgi:hypothetical protein